MDGKKNLENYLNYLQIVFPVIKFTEYAQKIKIFTELMHILVLHLTIVIGRY